MEENIMELTVHAEDAGKRLDAYLSEKLPDLSRNHIQILIEAAAVVVNGSGGAVKKYKVKEGDIIEVEIPEPEVTSIEPEDIPLDIVYEDNDVLVINKPKGMVVHPAAGNENGTMVNAIMFHCGDSLSGINGEVRPGIVHRIDKDTSGLIMVAKNDVAHNSLAKQLKEHSVTREYWALCYDNIKEDELTIDEPIGRDERNRLRKAVNGSAAREAVTHIEVLERFGKYTLVKAVLDTGRTHQIRVHMAYIKHPLVGDELYGPKKQPFKTNGQMLHAKTLGFVHPRTGEYLEFTSELPEEFERVLQAVRKR
jgi:23S rRNA pseudouridine1911/1915/1917 synthase